MADDFRDKLFADMPNGIGEEKDGTGIHGKNHPLILRVYTGNQGPQWLMVGGIRGGHEVEDAEFQIFYEGIIVWDGKPRMGWWQLIVKGSGLEGVRHYLTQGVQQTIREGAAKNQFEPSKPMKIDTITIMPFEVGHQDY